MRKRYYRRFLFMSGMIFALIIAGFLWPERIVIPVKDATASDWHANSFWYYPWGSSGVHRGIDIFAAAKQPVLSSTDGIVIYAGVKSKGGQALMILGPKWRVHYYAHLAEKKVRVGYWLTAGEVIGSVGTSGNAVGKQPHLHYSIRTLFPYFWQSDQTPYGSLKKWYIDPTPRFNNILNPKKNNSDD